MRFKISIFILSFCALLLIGVFIYTKYSYGSWQTFNQTSPAGNMLYLFLGKTKTDVSEGDIIEVKSNIKRLEGIYTVKRVVKGDPKSRKLNVHGNGIWVLISSDFKGNAKGKFRIVR